MSWTWEYVFGAEEAARTAPPAFLTEIERKADELVRAAEAQYLHGPAHDRDDPKGDDIVVPGGMFSYQIVVCSERVFVVQITYLGY
ncbi:hypothetical protein DD630_14775 [Streptomyces sp. BSE7F]|uniref:hypothetical protein n=1 Tax=Streptomyces sp. BSE7-9 TaxID=2759948 RepID=UPI000D611DE7|nr:hypothetical protein [Streptomyces sp. BSE7-9]MBJ6645404.1 hypothetical protein [Streptomyces sp. BSE7-9]PWE08050.1 hypothetical protein DD630_14775 [Streptomyces sp. BSE7F]